ncbi:unnamed protein product [Rotaria magnacalcarata]|nr:unnamed protein product [Rotaria magnacalcarata]CAF4159826.1 unnamed protein product [Rotaria magnacalcarata]CAF4470560.1 unnamed protein product [Rotaria magnacalcarata]CAF4504866.1 unnamed protein product [Rotaria magnacalcarata]
MVYNKFGIQSISRCLPVILKIVTKIRKSINVPFHFDQSIIEFINNIFYMLNAFIDSKTCSAIGRDFCLDRVPKFVDEVNGCNWTSQFIVSGVPELLRVIATVPNLSDNDKNNSSKIN